MTEPTQPTEADGVYPISAVERETGLSKDTLRMWERRYGFPKPTRDAQGERLYPAEQVARLRTLRRLIHAGHRPGKVVTLTAQALQALVQAVPSGPGPGPASGLLLDRPRRQAQGRRRAFC